MSRLLVYVSWQGEDFARGGGAKIQRSTVSDIAKQNTCDRVV